MKQTTVNLPCLEATNTLCSHTPAFCCCYFGTQRIVDRKLESRGCENNAGWPCHLLSQRHAHKTSLWASAVKTSPQQGSGGNVPSCVTWWGAGGTSQNKRGSCISPQFLLCRLLCQKQYVDGLATSGSPGSSHWPLGPSTPKYPNLHLNKTPGDLLAHCLESWSVRPPKIMIRCCALNEHRVGGNCFCKILLQTRKG